MSIDELDHTIKRTLGMNSWLKTVANMSKTIEPHAGASLYEMAKTISSQTEKFRGLGTKLSGMDLFMAQINKNNAAWKLGSADWLANVPALQHFSIPNTHFDLTKNFGIGVASMLTEAAKTNSLAVQLGKGIPQLFKESSAFQLLNKQNLILGQLSGLGSLGMKLSQYQNTFHTLGSLAASMAAKGFATISEEEYEFFDETMDEAQGITASVIEKHLANNADIERLENLIEAINSKIDTFNRSEFNTFGLWFGIVALFITIISFAKQLKDESDPAKQPVTFQHVNDLKARVVDTLLSNFNYYHPIWSTIRSCRMHSKRSLRSTTQQIIPPKTRVSVLERKGKWLNVTCLDKDSLPVTGWVLKKYLCK